MRLETASDHEHIRNEGLSQRTTPLLTARASRISDIPDLRLGRNQSRRFTSTSEALSLPLLFPQAGHSASASASLRSLPPMPLSDALSSPVPSPAAGPPLNLSLSVLFFLTLLRLQWQRSTASLFCLLFVLATASAHKFFVWSSIFARGKERQ